jgi:LysM repeat protein
MLLLTKGSDDDHENIAELSEPKIQYHTISKGDTLYAIARRNNVSVNDLCELNKISKNKVLKIGSKIRVK